MLRRGICAIAFGAPLLIIVSGQGCSDEPDIEDLCTWISSPTNCYARFANDVGSQCGNDYVEGSDPVANATGYFIARDALDVCVKNAGGQVIFDPPFDVAAFPPATGPAAFSFTMLDIRNVPCGSGTFNGPQTGQAYVTTLNFSVTINGVDRNDAGASTPDGGGSLPDDIVGGTFTSATGEGKGFDVTCPGGQETHHFSTLLVEKCPEHEQNVPRAVFDSSPGLPETDAAAGVAGFVRLRVYYPPVDPSVPDAPPRVVEYFDCTIPHPPHHCEDTVLNLGETDVDCGGTCASRRQCGDGQACLQSGDCLSGVCQTVQGILQCVGP